MGSKPNLDNGRCVIANDDCDKWYGGMGMCHFHYRRQKNGNDPYAPKRKKYGVNKTKEGVELDCGFEGCRRKAQHGGYCGGHYRQFRMGQGMWLINERKKCPVLYCDTEIHNKGLLCAIHRNQAWRFNLSAEDLILTLGDGSCNNNGCNYVGNLNIDHDHSCCPRGTLSGGRYSCGSCIRGALCRDCNTTLGSMQDNPRKMQGLLEYLNLSAS